VPVNGAGEASPVKVLPVAIWPHACGHLPLLRWVCMPRISSVAVTSESCPLCRPAMMVTGHVLAVRLPPDHPRGPRGCGCLSVRETCKTAEILILRHQLTVLQRRQPRRPKLDWADRALLATLLAVIPKGRRARAAAPGHPGHGPALAPRHRSAARLSGIGYVRTHSLSSLVVSRARVASGCGGAGDRPRVCGMTRCGSARPAEPAGGEDRVGRAVRSGRGGAR
jgi:hypothetical protein